MIRTSSSGRVSEMTTGTTHPDKHQSKTTMRVCKSKLNTKFSNNTAGTQSKYLSVGHLHPPRWLQPSWDWDTCTRHCDPREQCLESEHALWYHVTHAQNGTVQATNINTTLTGQLLVGLMVHVTAVYSITILTIHLPACLNNNKSARGYPITLVFS